MLDALAVINKIIKEHHTIREHVRLAGDTVTDIEALFTLQRVQSGWTQSSTQALIGKQGQLQQAIGFLEQGLKNHFASEAEALPPLLGKLLMKAILVEHDDIGRQIKNTKTVLANAELEGLSQTELLAKKSEIQQAISNLRQSVEEHASHEEIILNMMRRALESAEQADR